MGPAEHTHCIGSFIDVHFSMQHKLEQATAFGLKYVWLNRSELLQAVENEHKVGINGHEIGFKENHLLAALLLLSV